MRTSRRRFIQGMGVTLGLPLLGAPVSPSRMLIIANNLGHRDASLVLKLYGRHQVKADDLRRVRERGAI